MCSQDYGDVHVATSEKFSENVLLISSKSQNSCRQNWEWPSWPGHFPDCCPPKGLKGLRPGEDLDMIYSPTTTYLWARQGVEHQCSHRCLSSDLYVMWVWALGGSITYTKPVFIGNQMQRKRKKKQTVLELKTKEDFVFYCRTKINRRIK